MKPFKLHDPVIWIDEQTNDITGIITEVNKGGFRIHWEMSSQLLLNNQFYPWEYLGLKTQSGNSVIRLDISKIREKKISTILQ